MSYDYLFRIILIGDTRVGKTSLCYKLTDDKFLPSCESTIGVDFSSLNVTIANRITIKCQFWDTAGCERFRAITKSYYHDTAIIILVFSLADETTFNSLESWIHEINHNVNTSNHKILLIGNQTDKNPRRIDFQEAMDFAKSHNAFYLETSAKDDDTLYTRFKDFLEDVFLDSDFMNNCSGVRSMVSMKKKAPKEIRNCSRETGFCCGCNVM